MGMAGLRLRGITKQPTDVRITSNVGLPCEIEIPPIGLGLSGKGVLEISMCLASLQVTHFFSSSWIDFPLADHRLIIVHRTLRTDRTESEESDANARRPKPMVDGETSRESARDL